MRRRSPTAPPIAVVALAVVGIGVFLGLPLAGLLWKTPWRSFGDVLGDGATRDALRVSLVCSVSATGIAFVIGLPIAWWLARSDFPGRSVVRALALLPLVLPPVVGGVALFDAFGRRGLVGQWLDEWFGVRIPFTIWAAILAEAFVAMPFFVVTVEGALQARAGVDEHAAATLGAGPVMIMRRVTLPAILPSVVAGLALAWARALGEFGATITFAGNLRGRTQTLPLAIYLAFENDEPAGLVTSVLLLVVSVVVLVVVGRRVWNGRADAGGAP